MKLKNEKHLKSLYREAYRIGTVFHLTKHKTDEMEDKIAEVRRKFKVVYLCVPLTHDEKRVIYLNCIDLILIIRF